MHNIRKIHENIFYVGVNDRRLQRFENMFPIDEGVSYNAYLLRGEKTCLIDTVDAGETIQFLDNVAAALDGRGLDYLVVQHMEPDHCGVIELILRRYPEAKLIGNSKTFTLFEQFYTEDLKERYQCIAEGDALELGGFTLKFVMAPMVHWPEVFVSYETQTGTLFSADAFGSFGAISGNLFGDEVELDGKHLNEMRRYYANIVGKHGLSVQRLFPKLQGIDIRTICPLHSLCYRTPEDIGMVLEKYTRWAAYEPEEKGVVIAFASMYGNTALAADVLGARLAERGVRNVRLFDVSQTHPSFIIGEIWKYSGVVFAGMNYNTELYYNMHSLLTELVGCGFQNRDVALIGNMSWGGRAVNIMQEILAKAKDLRFIAEPFMLKSSLKSAQSAAMDELAAAIAETLR